MKTLLYTTLAMFAFAANSILCRMALGTGSIDAAAFTSIRLVSGVIVLSSLLLFTGRKEVQKSRGSWKGGLMLFLYAITFSYAYLSLDTGTGALVLFGSVQMTMILMTLVMGYCPSSMEWGGLLLAFAGFVYLVLPGVTAPPLGGFVLMLISGIAWGFYSLNGRQSENPLMDTGYNFLRTLPFVVLLLVVTFKFSAMTMQGVILAIVSGGIASGIGYAIWYTALRGLTSTVAAVVQLSVPLIAALGGILLLSESLTLRLGLASILILSGILLVIYGRYRMQKPV
jgi:drug/metabolite transporter (DMT)-like permease